MASKETGLNADKTKYMVMFREQNAGRSRNIKFDNSSFEGVKEFKYLGTNLTNQNSIQEEIKSRLRSGSSCYSVQNLLSSSLLSENTKIKIYRTIVLHVVLCGCETRSLALREERRLRVLWRIFGPKMGEVTEEWRKLRNEELNDLYSSPNNVRVMKSRRMRWAGHVVRMGGGEAYRGFWWGNLKERDHLGDPGIDWRILLRWIFRKWDVGVWTGSSWPSIGTCGGYL